jgi:D-alanyl-D-alanine dipeptidase
MSGAASTLLLLGAWLGAGDGDAPAGFVDVGTLAPPIAVSMQYAGARNFVGRPVRGYRAPRCLLAAPAAEALGRVARDLAGQKLALLVYDCYRPRRAVADFVAWGRDLGDTTTQSTHYPAVPKAELFKRGYIAHHSGHSRGSTVDLTLIPLAAAESRKAPAPATTGDCRTIGGPAAPDGSLDMGTMFDCFDERSRTDSPDISPTARRNRALLRAAMERQGFVNYPKEWWHFTLANEPYPSTSFDFEIR